MFLLDLNPCVIIIESKCLSSFIREGKCLSSFIREGKCLSSFPTKFAACFGSANKYVHFVN